MKGEVRGRRRGRRIAGGGRQQFRSKGYLIEEWHWEADSSALPHQSRGQEMPGGDAACALLPPEPQPARGLQPPHLRCTSSTFSAAPHPSPLNPLIRTLWPVLTWRKHLSAHSWHAAWWVFCSKANKENGDSVAAYVTQMKYDLRDNRGWFWFFLSRSL